ncbi:MAG: DUF2891 domain-containing protein [Betaproteobacteria bacterium]|nr:DUF2891 domain-containing protein [Betaproteobacteria bacterium]
MLTTDHARRFAAIALANIASEYPAKLDHVLASPADAAVPSTLHPAFHGSFDWHSCVHMHWLLARIRRGFPGLDCRRDIDAAFALRLVPDAIAAEVAYLARAHSRSFERSYGWAWLLKLATELSMHDDVAGRRHAQALQPLADAFVQRYLTYLPRAGYAIRHGMHANSAFGLAFALDYARATGHGDLARQCTATALAWFGDDRDAPARWEPSGADFLSPCLMEAALMRRVLETAAFAAWLEAFLPGLVDEAHPLATPVSVADRGDPQTVHLDGLNLSRAWCFADIALALPARDPRVGTLRAAADRHLGAGWQGLASDDYVGGHWLASFALLALEARAELG